MERDCGEDIYIDVGIGELLPRVGFVDTCTCWRVSSMLGLRRFLPFDIPDSTPST
jgi:hypothetical protein